jgi:hypothetical protein
MKTKEVKTHQDVVWAVDAKLLDPEVCRIAVLYHRGKMAKRKEAQVREN